MERGGERRRTRHRPVLDVRKLFAVDVPQSRLARRARQLTVTVSPGAMSRLSVSFRSEGQVSENAALVTVTGPPRRTTENHAAEDLGDDLLRVVEVHYVTCLDELLELVLQPGPASDEVARWRRASGCPEHGWTGRSTDYTGCCRPFPGAGRGRPARRAPVEPHEGGGTGAGPRRGGAVSGAMRARTCSRRDVG